MKAKIISKVISAVLSAAVMVTSLPAMAMAAPAETAVGQEAMQDEEKNLLKLWYDEPASQGNNILGAGAYNPSAEDNNWQQHTLPLGNSFMGANVYGEIANERLTFNQKTLWNGGPSASRPNYNGGNKQRAEAYQDIVNAFLAGDDARASRLCDQYLNGEGESGGYGVYQSWGDIYLKYKELENVSNVTGYERNLDLTEGIANVDFNAAGTNYHREYFISYPDNVLAMKLTSDNGSGMNLNVSFPIDNGENATEQASIKANNLGKNIAYDVDAAAGTIVSSGTMQDNQMKLNSMLKVAATGGTVTEGSDKQSLDIAGAREVTIFISADTDYKNSYPTYRTGESEEQLAASVKNTVEKAAAKGYDKVKSMHLLDYQELFNRVELDLGQAASDKTTDVLLAAYKAGGSGVTDAERRLLEVLLYQYGRYLTIASSRSGDLPSNLQGVWQNRVGTSGKVPWGSDFHMNVNLQMNYWPTYSANLAECATPLVDYVNSLREPGRVTAENYYGIKSEPGEANGFTAHTQNSPYGWTCPGWDFYWGWSPAAVPWIIQNCWEYYEYTGDLEYMRTQLYPMMKEETILYDQILVDSGVEITLADGSKSTRLVSAPAYSPELGPYTLGNVYENGLIWQLYEDTITAAKLLKVDSDLVARWEETQERLSPIEVGDSGQIKEWYHETTIGSVANMTNHRHMSHLLELFPGDLISVENEDYMDAAVVSLLDRGDTSTGWGMGQRINAWARTGDGNHAYVLIQSLFNNGIYPNLWDAHPPFQIDGNFGYTSGVNEMLMQSNVGYINILPALPDVWGTGSVNGIVARDNFELGIDWSNKKATEVRILSKNGNSCTVQYPGIGTATVTDSKGRTVAYTAVEGKANRITFDTVKGETYTITGMGEDVRLEAPVNCEAERNGDSIVLTWDAVAGAASYNIYKKDSAGAASEKINNQAVTATAFTDSASRYEDIYAVQYMVTAVKDGLEGKRSEKFSLPAPQLPIEVVDETDGRIKYEGGWNSWSAPEHYGGSIKFIETAAGTESVEFPFEGTGITILARKHSGRYSAQWKVYIDGEEAGVADCRAEESQFQYPVFAKYDLPKGQHTVKLTTEGNEGKKIEFDAFVVYREADAGITVTYDLGGTEGTAPAPMKQKCRDIIILPSCDAERFVGWSDGNTTYPAGSQVQLSYSDVVFTAVYEEDNTSSEYLPISKTGWTATAGSEETVGEDGAIRNAIDDNENTFWHSQWYYSDNRPTFGENGQKNEYTIDFGKEITIDKFEYVPRTVVGNGFITEYKLFSSQTADGDDFTEIASGIWHEDDGGSFTDTERKSVVFDEAKTMRRIQIRAIHTDGREGKDKYIHAVEFNVYRKNENYVPPVMPSEIRAENLTLELGESKALNVQVEPANADNKELSYVSSDPMKVFVYPNGTVTASKYNSGTATITITANGNPQVTKEVTVTVNPPAKKEVTSIRLEKERIVLKPGEETSIEVAIEPYFGTDKTIVWESSAPAVVTVANGRITALAEGKATITARTVNNKSAVCQVLVSAAEPDRTELLGMVSELKAQYSDLSGYTEEEQAVFREAMSNAEKVLAYGNNVSPSELEEAVLRLQNAMETLTGSGTFIISFDANGGDKTSVPDRITGKKTGEKVDLSALAAPTRNGYVFKGWSMSADGTAKDVLSEVTIGSSDMVLYAVWEKTPEETTYKVTFEANAGQDTTVKGMPKEIEGRKTGEKVDLSALAAPTRNGYIFKGWGMSADSTAKDVLSEVTIGSSDMVLYAVWEKTAEETTYKVTFEANAGQDTTVEGMPKEIEGRKTGEKVDLFALAAPTRNGYIFKGWGMSADSTAKDVLSEVTIGSSDMVLYAVWEKEPLPPVVSYTVKFKGNGTSTGVPASCKVASGSKLAQPSKKPVRSGYDFQGWSKTADGTVVKWPQVITKNTTFYAIWKKQAPPFKDGVKMTDKKTKITYKVISAKKKTALVLKGGDKKATSISIPATVKINGKSCKVVAIGKNAFKACSKLKKVTLGKYVTEIQKNAFNGCTRLEKVTMDKNLKVISTNAFSGCKKLKSITLKGITLKSVKSGAFKNTSKSLTVKVPKGTKNAQKAKLLKILKKGGNNKVKVK